MTVNGTVTATSFSGELPGLTEKVSKTGDTMTGSLTIGEKQNPANLTVNGTVTATSFSGELPGLTEKVSKTGDTMTGSLTIGEKQNPANLTVNGTVTATSFSGNFPGLTEIENLKTEIQSLKQRLKALEDTPTISVQNHSNFPLKAFQNDRELADLPAGSENNPSSTFVQIDRNVDLLILNPSTSPNWELVCKVSARTLKNGSIVKNDLPWGGACNTA